jgi:hypothetical protein
MTESQHRWVRSFLIGGSFVGLLSLGQFSDRWDWIGYPLAVGYFFSWMLAGGGHNFNSIFVYAGLILNCAIYSALAYFALRFFRSR